MVGDLIDFPPSFLSCWNDEGLTAIMFFDRLGHEYRSLIERNAQNDFSILSQGSCCISEYINFITSCHHPKKKQQKNNLTIQWKDLTLQTDLSFCTYTNTSENICDEQLHSAVNPR